MTVLTLWGHEVKSEMIDTLPPPSTMVTIEESDEVAYTYKTIRGDQATLSATIQPKEPMFKEREQNEWRNRQIAELRRQLTRFCTAFNKIG